MNYILLSINYAAMILIPIIVALFIHSKTRASFRFFFIGAVTFILSQVLHIPFNAVVQSAGWLPTDLTSWPNLLLVGLFAGLSAGVFEETARYLTYRFWAKDARSWSRGLMLGAGHGGIEAILLGALGAISFVSLIATTRNETAMSVLPAEQRALVEGALADILNTPWYGLLLGGLERVFAILAHLAMSVIVLQAFLRRSIRWLFLAIGYHAALDMLAVVAVQRVGPYATEGLLAVFSLLSIYVIFRLRTPDPVAPEPEPLPPPPPAEPLDLQPTGDALDRSRYTSGL